MFRIYLLVLSHLLRVNCYSDHYWVDYDGLIPPNAIPAETNSSTQCDSYIGQGYYHGYGLMVGTVTPGKMDMEMAYNGVVKTNIMIKSLTKLKFKKSSPPKVHMVITHNIPNKRKYLVWLGERMSVVFLNNMLIFQEILCAPHPEEYQWLPTTSATFRNDIAGEIPIIGGYDRKQTGSLGVLHIGRTLEQRRAIIGYTTTFRKGNVMFYYPLNGTKRNATKYEVLVYRSKPIL